MLNRYSFDLVLYSPLIVVQGLFHLIYLELLILYLFKLSLCPQTQYVAVKCGNITAICFVVSGKKIHIHALCMTRSLFCTGWGVPVAIMGLRFQSETSANTSAIHQWYISVIGFTWWMCCFAMVECLQSVPCILHSMHIVHESPFHEQRWVRHHG